MKLHGIATILRWGLAFVFFYAAVASLVSPQTWAPYIPSFLTSVIPTHFLLAILSFYELILAVALFWGKKLYWSSLLATITFGLVVVVGFDSMDIVFENVGLAFSALALFELNKNLEHNDALE